MNKHTPGPWKLVVHTAEEGAVIDGGDDWTVTGADGTKVCFEGGYTECADANARLIAAAPELLEAAKLALSEAESWIHDQLDGTSSLEGALQKLAPVRAAIFKATGESL